MYHFVRKYQSQVRLTHRILYKDSQKKSQKGDGLRYDAAQTYYELMVTKKFKKSAGAC